MFYYTVNKIGNGTESDPYRPDIPEGSSFVGNIGSDDEYLVGMNVELSETTKRKRQLPRQALEKAGNAKGIPFQDIDKWFVGGS